MRRERNIGREIVADAHGQVRSGERLTRLLSATSRISSVGAACSAMELYIHHGDAPKALAALSLFAFIETTREVMTILQKKEYDSAVVEKINRHLEANVGTTDRPDLDNGVSH